MMRKLLPPMVGAVIAAAPLPPSPAETVERQFAGNFVSDHETIVGTRTRAIAVYDTHDGLIRRAKLFSPPAN